MSELRAAEAKSLRRLKRALFAAVLVGAGLAFAGIDHIPLWAFPVGAAPVAAWVIHPAERERFRQLRRL